MPILRNKTQKNFTMISNNIFRDKDLSLKDRGLICTLMSLPDSWEFSISGLSSILKDGKDSIRTSLNYLEQLGYIRRYNSRNSRGQFETVIEVTYEKHNSTDNSLDGLSVSENPSRNNRHGNTASAHPTEFKNNNLNTIDKIDNKQSIILSDTNKKENTDCKMNDKMNDIPNLHTFIEATKRRVNYQELLSILNLSEIQYVDKIITIISAYIADPNLRSAVKIAGKYIDDDKAITHLLHYKYAEIYAVTKNMINSGISLDKPDSYYLTALEHQLQINSPELYAIIDDPITDDNDE